MAKVSTLQPKVGKRAKTAERGYGGKWQRERLQYLAEHPLCVMCQAENRITAASVVDHVIPHKGDHKLMWSRSNWQSLCKPHHDRDKQMLDRGSQAPRVIGIDGWPAS